MTVRIARTSLRGVWWRQVAAGLDPLELRDPPGDGRWQHGEVVGAIYLADSEETVWAEWYRALAELAVPPATWLPCDLWRIRVELDVVADLTGAKALGALGLGPPVPGRATWPPYQRVGERLAADGFEGLLASSASRPQGRVLCLFSGEDRSAGAHTSGRPRRIDAAPVPPRDLRT